MGLITADVVTARRGTDPVFRGISTWRQQVAWDIKRGGLRNSPHPNCRYIPAQFTRPNGLGRVIGRFSNMLAADIGGHFGASFALRLSSVPDQSEANSPVPWCSART